MHDGKKSVAQNVFYDALDIVKKRVPDKEPIEVFTQAVEHVKPSIEVRSKRVGGAAYQVPMQVNRTRQQSLAIRWILLAIREKKGRADRPEAGRRIRRRVQPRRRRRQPPRKRPPHGRRQQGVRPLRVVDSNNTAAAAVTLSMRGVFHAQDADAGSRSRSARVAD